MSWSTINVYHAYPANSVVSVVVQAGDLIEVNYSYNNTLQTVTCSDNAAGGSNSYNQVGTGISDGSGQSGHKFYTVAKASETLTITLTSQADGGLSVHVARSTVAITLGTVLDQSNTIGADSFGTTHNGATVTTTTANQYLSALWLQEAGTATDTENGTSFNKQTEDAAHHHSTFDRSVTSTGTYGDNMTSSVGAVYTYMIASYKDTGGGGGLAGDEGEYSSRSRWPDDITVMLPA